MTDTATSDSDVVPVAARGTAQSGAGLGPLPRDRHCQAIAEAVNPD